ncbi:SpoIIE family protein phosphatase [Nonomuraea africana]|uniref:PAS domain S-box-containing protein n=1 Tax=Nonomuraea africana TaxID=46171 RepID=A0ABR9KC62_9ACTN|nr:SpoIIE family protein phosphatase [Nonomuraea africana]MBE1559303.1 PAS domain S-box-containing protein [Nonomuraea africana]
MVDPFGHHPGGPSPPGGLLDMLNVAAVVVDTGGRIVLWSPQAEQLFGYPTQEALGQYAGRLLVDPEHLTLVMELFEEVMETGRPWVGVFPVRVKDGSIRQVEFRNMRLQDDRHNLYALAIATDQATVRQVETDLALSDKLIDQSPIGLAILDTDLRYVTVNPALERINGRPAAEHTGRTVHEVLTFVDAAAVEAAMRQVLATGVPLIDLHEVDLPSGQHAWSTSYYRLEDTAGHVLGVAVSVVDVTERHKAAVEAAVARRRLAMVAEATVRVGTTLDLQRTARELAEVVVPDLADLATVDVLEEILTDRRAESQDDGLARFRALAVVSAYPTEAIGAADPVDEVVTYDADRLAARCVTSAAPILVPRVEPSALHRIARDAAAAVHLSGAGVHSYLAVPLIARGEVLGVLCMVRARNQTPFDQEDLVLATELASRAAVCIDNARLYRNERNTVLTLQRSLLPQPPPHRPGLKIAYRYLPAGAGNEVGGDWFDVIPLAEGKTALVVGDVMGSGIAAATTMGQLRTATSTLAALDLDPAEVLRHLDDIAAGLSRPFVTCVYAVCDPAHGRCRVSTAGHLPPVLVPAEGAPELVAIPPGAPLGVGGVDFTTVTLPLAPGSLLVLYTDGLVETRDEPIDQRLETLCRLLDGPRRPPEETCEALLRALRPPDDRDDVVLLVAHIRPGPAEGRPATG